MLHLDGQVHHDTHAVPMGNYVIAVGNYVIVSPSELGNYKIADNWALVLPHSFLSECLPRGDRLAQPRSKHGFESTSD